MNKPGSEDILAFHRYFAIQSNNEFWQRSEGELSQEEKKELTALAYASLFHWREVGTDDNIHLAYLAVARAYCVNDSLDSVYYAKRAFEYFDGRGENWIQAFTNAVLSHALHISGETTRCAELYENAVRFNLDCSEGDRKVFDATFKRIPVPI